jgi:hypothetical protein
MVGPLTSIVSALSSGVANSRQAIHSVLPSPLIEPDVQISRIRLSDSLSLQSIRKELTACSPYRYTSP